ncbi:ER membrane protein complex subunit 8 [Porphyridium purpureum]|uniref:ER membrane protein complex subunit 8 n=1 Tax=Porphyridium purpureum TaxID=35688 RepID=A0A5J4Z5Z7_PORPP|nr:ER membrane protein complex subunit 8 [Porphyridium purpureum]|eukprot:POR1527..scf295_1
MPPMRTATIEYDAYAVAQAHSAKHCFVNVLGVLLASRESPTGLHSAAAQTQVSPDTVRIVESVPLCHDVQETWPRVQAAMMIASKYALRKGLVIVGVYVANEVSEDTRPPRTAMLLLNRIVSGTQRSTGVLAVFEPKALPDLSVVRLWAPKPGSDWNAMDVMRWAPGSILRVESLPSAGSEGLGADEADAFDEFCEDQNVKLHGIVRALRRIEVIVEVVDFDDHCARPSLDWLGQTQFLKLLRGT